MAEFAYDQVQYDSHPYRQSHPERLYTLARLFGLSPTDYRHARILELGCASGGNIIPIAYNHPDCQVVGIDLSEKQIEAGKAFARSLKLSNIELLTLSILDIPPDLGHFDYIICHGIYSWVPQIVRDKIFKILNDHLTPQGVAYVSYNTYPGWNVVHSMRDMMMYHTQSVEALPEKAKRARQLLEFMAESLKEEKTPYSEFLYQEMDLIKKQPDSYLLHDHLEEVNFPTYFHSFMAKANANGLDYLADAKIHAMFLGNLPEKAASVLGMMPDIIKSNQYMDFIRNQRFRATLLCLNTVNINRQLTSSQVESFYISYIGGYSKEGVSESDLLAQGAPVVFPGLGITLTVRHPLSKVAMVLLQEKRYPILYSEFLSALQDRLKSYGLSYEIEFIAQHIKEDLNIMRLVFGGIIELSSMPPLYTTQVSLKPNTTELIKEQLKMNTVLTNQRHEVIRVNELEKKLLQALDGQTSLEEIAAQWLEQIKLGTLSLEGIDIEKRDTATLQAGCERMCQKLANSALFIS